MSAAAKTQPEREVKATSSVSVDIVIPVYNEEKDLARSVLRLREFLRQGFKDSWRIVIVDNGSTDSTWTIAQMLSQKFPEVSCLHLDQKGRGRALRHAWLQSRADIVSYMDVDLSTELKAFPELVAAIKEGYPLAIGSRLRKGARVRRSLKREAISRAYNLLIKSLFFTRFTDAQCGFKALSREAAQTLVPLVKDCYWFFDTELLILAEKRGYPIREIPVEWREDPDSRVHILRDAWADIKGLLRLRFGGIPQIQRGQGDQHHPPGT